MVSTKELQELIKLMSKIETAEAEYEAALEAYRDDKSDSNRERYKAAAENLGNLRNERRTSGVQVSSNAPGDATVSNANARMSGKAAELLTPKTEKE